MSTINLLPNDLKSKKRFKIGKKEPLDSVVNKKKDHFKLISAPISKKPANSLPLELKSPQPPVEMKLEKQHRSHASTEHKKFNEEIKKQEHKEKQKKPTINFWLSLGTRLKSLLHKKVDETENSLNIELLRADLVGVRSSRSEIMKLFLLFLAVVVIIGIVWGYDTYMAKQHVGITAEKQKKLDLLNTRIVDLKSQQQAIEESAGLIKTIYTLLDKRIFWPDILEIIEQLTLKDVYYTEIKCDNGLNLSLNARARDINDAMLQLEVFKQAEGVETVSFEKFQLVEETVTVLSRDESVEPLQITSSFIEFPIQLKLNTDFLSISPE